jgi:hypothetical protein
MDGFPLIVNLLAKTTRLTKALIDGVVAIPRYAYLKHKIPGPAGVILVEARTQ